MKKILLKSLICAGLLGCFTFAANAQNSLVQSVGVTARLADQMSVTKLSDVDFGGIFIPKNGSDVTVSMDYTGIVSVSAGNTALYDLNLQRQGQIMVSADQAATFAVTYPATVQLTNTAAAGGTLTYTPLLYDNAGVLMASDISTIFNVADMGNGLFGKVMNIAGTLAVPQTAKPGLYNGTVDVTITWN